MYYVIHEDWKYLENIDTLLNYARMQSDYGKQRTEQKTSYIFCTNVIVSYAKSACENVSNRYLAKLNSNKLLSSCSFTTISFHFDQETPVYTMQCRCIFILL